MPAITITLQYAWASATDAANMQMRKAGRRKWNLDDRNKAAEVFNRLWTIEDELSRRSQSAK